MMLKLTSGNGNKFLVNCDKLIRIRFHNNETTIVFSDDDYEKVKETPDEIMAQIEYVKTTELGIERIFKNPMYNADLMLDMMRVLSDVQRFKNNRNFEL